VTKDSGPLFLYNADTQPWSPFFNLTLGEQPINKATPAIITNDTVGVTDKAELIKWLNQMYDKDSVDLSIRSWPLIRVGVIPTYNYLDKTIQVPGLRGLQGAAVKDLQIQLPPPKNGPNVKGKILLPNWSVLVLNLGNLTMDLFSGKVKLGHVEINDVILPPGNTTKEFQGELYLDALGPNLGKILADQAAPLGRGVIELNATNTTAMNNGQHVEFLEKVLSTKTVTLDISVVSFLSDVVSSLLHDNSQKNLVDVLGDIVGNSSFIEKVLDNFNSTSVSTNGTSAASRVKAKRSSERSAMAWNLLRLGMKMKARI